MEAIIFIFALVAFLVFYTNYRSKKDNKEIEEMKQQAKYDEEHPEEKKEREYTEDYPTGKIISGHPDIAKPYERTALIVSRIDVIIYEIGPFNQLKEVLGKIPLVQIKSVKVEDRSTIESHVTAGRLLLLSVFAFAAKKKETHPDFYLVVDWNDGRFDFATIFEFSGEVGRNANEAANNAYNIIIKRCREQTVLSTI